MLERMSTKRLWYFQRSQFLLCAAIAPDLTKPPSSIPSSCLVPVQLCTNHVGFSIKPERCYRPFCKTAAQQFYAVAPDGSWQATIPAAGHMSFLRASPSPVDWALRRLCPGCSPQVRMEAAGTAGHGGGTWECGPCRPSAIPHQHFQTYTSGSR